MQVFFVAGEPSGDRHAAALARELLARRPELELEGYGMDAMRDAGVKVLFDMRELAVMWFLAVAARLPTFVGLIYRTFRDWRDRPPDVIVFVDYPGLNLLLARYAKGRRIPVLYFIPPQLWAWAPWRRRQLARRTDRVLTVLPFEAAFLADAGVAATYVGHPLGDEEWGEPSPERGRVLLMPGSRTAELDAHLELFLAVAARLRAAEPEASFTLVVAREQHRPRIAAAVAASGLSVELLPASEGRDAFRRARVAVAKSGTTTLELALAGVPLVVVYKVGRLAGCVGRAHLTSPFIGLVNIVAGCEIAPEFLISTDRSAEIAASALELYRDGEPRTRALGGLATLRKQMGRPGTSARAAKEVLALMDSRAGSAQP